MQNSFLLTSAVLPVKPQVLRWVHSLSGDFRHVQLRVSSCVLTAPLTMPLEGQPVVPCSICPYSNCPLQNSPEAHA